jgi:hypothetical protein
MSVEEMKQKLTCRQCGGPRVVTRANKPSKTEARLTMECPIHEEEVVYTLPTSLFEQAPGLVREHLLLCRACGKPVQVVGSSVNGLLRTLEVRCPEHGLGERVVNETLYNQIMAATPGPTPAAAAPGPRPAIAGAANFCPSCGVKIAIPGAQFCSNCGASLT